MGMEIYYKEFEINESDKESKWNNCLNKWKMI